MGNKPSAGGLTRIPHGKADYFDSYITSITFNLLHHNVHLEFRHLSHALKVTPVEKGF